MRRIGIEATDRALRGGRTRGGRDYAPVAFVMGCEGRGASRSVRASKRTRLGSRHAKLEKLAAREARDAIRHGVEG